MASKPNHPLWREGSPGKTASAHCQEPSSPQTHQDFPAQQYGAWLEHSQHIWSEEQDEDTQEPLLLQQKQAKLRPNPCVTAVVMSIGMSLLQLPLELQVSLLGCWRSAWGPGTQQQ